MRPSRYAIGDLLPPSVVAVERLADEESPCLYAEEQAVVRNAAPVRRREFATVRYCAREALQGLGVPPAPLLPGPRGAPIWPAGVVGSMTHCQGYRAAAVALGRDFAGIGIDSEPDAPLPAGVVDVIARDEERQRLATLAGTPPSYDRLLFSAKEALYKAWYPLTRRWLDFHDVTVTLRRDGSFTAHVMVAGPCLGGVTRTVFDGRWRCVSGLLLTAVVVPSSTRPESDLSRI